MVQDLKGDDQVEIDMVATGLDLKILDQEKVEMALLVEIGGVMVQVIMKIEVIVTEKMMRGSYKNNNRGTRDYNNSDRNNRYDDSKVNKSITPRTGYDDFNRF